MSADDHHFDAKRIFWLLFIFTAVEVAWGMVLPYEKKFLLWSGLLLCAIAKGWLIFVWFMHMKFEGWIVKALIVPTIPLMLVVYFSLMPDVANNKQTLYNLADQVEESTGEVIEIGLSTGGEVGHGDDDKDGGH